MFIKRCLIPLYIASIVLMTITLTSCIGAGLSDWSYRINDSYEISSANSEEIYLNQTDGHIIIPEYISEFCYNDRYICVKRISYDHLDIPAQYFIVDMDTDEVFGPYTSQEDFEREIERIKVGVLNDWISTNEIKKSGVIYPSEN